MEVIGRFIDPQSIVQVKPASDNEDPNLENIRLISGRGVDLVGDDSAHLDVHMAFLQSPEFKKATLQGQLVLQGHISSHLIRQNDGGVVFVSQRRD